MGRIGIAAPMWTLTLLVLVVLLTAIERARAEMAPTLVTLRTRCAVFAIDVNGAVSTLSIRGKGACLAIGQPAPLLTVRVDGKLHAPDRAVADKRGGRLTLRYGDVGITVIVAVVAKPSHVAFTVVDIQPPARADLAIWGPYPTKIHDIVGETVGVVRDTHIAVGLQALNPKTIGGYPDRENDEDAGYDAADPGVYPDLDPELKKDQGWRGNVARATTYGSSLQAYCRDRGRERVIANWDFDRFVAPALDDGGIVGSGIALFACPASMALATIGEIEIAEELPHPMIDGVWGKVSPAATASYLIVDFSEENVDRAIEMTRRAGLKYLYHSSPFATWGHFALKPDLFPRGWDGLKACIDKARVAGIHVGFHTLSNFITPNDPYVTPVPDPRLARVGSSTLTADIDTGQTEIPVTEPGYYAKSSSMNTVMIGEELIRYKSVSTEAPWRLLGCERGAWSTRAVVHKKGADTARLADHSYNVFLGNASLSTEVARNIADLFNHVGALQTSFDGLEGNHSTALGQYGRALFTKAWFDTLSPALRGHVINDASNPEHFNWHINTRMNWGEPWYAGFRESQTLYRFKNQVYFTRNFIPHMLGWFALRADTSIEDAEWLLARAAGFDAGFTLATSLASTAQLAADSASVETSKHYGATTAILEAVRQWETARMAGAFPAHVKALLRDNAREFHLQPAGVNRWNLFAAHLSRLVGDTATSNSVESSFNTTDTEQPLQWTVRSIATKPIGGLGIELDGCRILDMKDASIAIGASVKYAGGPEAVVFDSTWKEIMRVPVDSRRARVGVGPHRLLVNWAGHAKGGIKIEIRTYGPPIQIRK